MDSPSPHPFRDLSNRDLAASITELMGHLNAANRRWLAMIAEFDRRQGWSDSMTQSCAHWLNWQCGLALGAAREKVRVAHALEELPLIGAAMGRGELSYAKVRELTRIATVATEQYLLSIALHGTASHVERLVRQYRRVLEVEELSREARQQAGRSVSYSFDADGSLVLKARLPAEAGMLVLKALEAAMADLSLPKEDCVDPVDVGRCRDTDVSAGTFTPGYKAKVSKAARRADALALIAESFMAHGAESMNGGDRFQIVVHVDHETLKDKTAGRSEFEDGPSVPAGTSQRLACDCSYVKITEDENGEPLNVGRKTRSIPPAMRRALNSRDQGCVFPGCTHQKYVDGHHVHHWAEGGETKLGNLVSLCRFHHRQVHEGGVRIERLDDGAWRFIRPDGEAFVATSPGHTQPMQGDWETVARQHAERGLHIDPHTARTRWRGESMDYGIAIDVLLAKDRQAPQPKPDDPRTSQFCT
jgi:hypothetical protein